MQNYNRLSNLEVIALTSSARIEIQQYMATTYDENIALILSARIEIANAGTPWENSSNRT